MTRTEPDTWSCNGTTVSYTEWADQQPDNKYMGRTPASFTYLSADQGGKWADGGSELDYSGIKFNFMCSFPCVVGEEEGCIPDKYPGQHTTVVVHSSSNSDMVQMERVEKDEVSTDVMSDMESDNPYTASLDISKVMEFITTNYNGYYGKKFVVGGTNKDFFEASNICRELEGALPCIQNIVQQEMVAGLNNGSVWLGAVDYYEEGVWECESGDSLAWTNWADGQPDDMVRASFFLS